MYIEKNGFLVVNPTEMSFLTEDRDFSDDLECAELFSSNNSALEAISQFVNGEKEYIVLRCNTTIWIDKDAIQPKIDSTCNCEEGCCCNKQDLDRVEKEILDKYSL